MRRADRLFQIVQYLRGGRLTTAARLAETLEVSERTIYRDIADLQASGVPIDGEAGVGYVMRNGYDLPPLMFTRDEIVALVAGARLIRAWGGADRAHRAAARSVVLGQGLDAGRLVRAAQRFPHVPTRPDHKNGQWRRGVPARARQDPDRFLPHHGRAALNPAYIASVTRRIRPIYLLSGLNRT